MQRILSFILDNKNAFLYTLFLTLSIVLTVDNHLYHQSTFFNSSKAISGTIYNKAADIKGYFTLKEENEKLIQENLALRKKIFNSANANTEGFKFKKARVIKNSFNSPRNYLTIDMGWKQGITQDMGLISPSGIVGIIENTSRQYATVQSVLNINSNINAKIKGSNHFGSLVWEMDDPQIVKLYDIPKSAVVQKNDTIITGGMSSIFPEGILIGTVMDYSLPDNQSSYDIQVSLFTDMTNLGDVYVVENANQREILRLQNKIKDD